MGRRTQCRHRRRWSKWIAVPHGPVIGRWFQTRLAIGPNGLIYTSHVRCAITAADWRRGQRPGIRRD